MATVGDIYAVKLVSYDTSQLGINLLHFAVTAVAGTGQTDLQLANGLQALIQPLYINCLNNNASFRGIVVQKVSPLPVTIATTSTGAAAAGVGGAVALPKQTSGLISAYTALAGRAYRSRVYVAFPSATHNQLDGTPTAGYVTAISNLAVQLLNLITIGGGGNTVTLSSGVYHRTLRTITPWVSTVARNKWATQRKRGDEGRTNPVPF